MCCIELYWSKCLHAWISIQMTNWSVTKNSIQHNLFMNGLQLVYHINTHILCVSLSVILWSQERNVVVPRFLHHHWELHLVRYSNRFSSWRDAQLEDKAFGTFLHVMHETMPFTLQQCNTLKIGRVPEKSWAFLPSTGTQQASFTGPGWKLWCL